MGNQPVSSIESMYLRYLRIVGLSEANMHDVQKRETRNAFYGAIGMIIDVMGGMSADMPDADMDALILSWMSQIETHFQKNLEEYLARNN